ncbi:MAG TPA: methionine synthase, partial [Aeromicrobium sp.]|nr:methionine synthase [Aeromicrobium sp.]
WTLAATVERPRGDRILADHGARRDLAQSLAEGVREHLADVARRVRGASLILQIDEPALTAVLAAQIPTASGWGRHRSIYPPEADSALRLFAEVAHAAGASAVLHTCAPDVPVKLIAGAGFDALSFDLALASGSEEWAEVFDGGMGLWPGVVPPADTENVKDSALVHRVDAFMERLGFDPETVTGALVVTPACGLADASPAWARRALALSKTVGAAR